MTITQTTITQTQALDLWRRALLESVRADAPDLSSRQMAILLTVYLTPPPHTVRGLAQTLSISKPAVTRALDRLGELGLLKRRPDETDRRSVLVQRTVKGSVFLSDFAGQVMGAAQQAASGGMEPSVAVAGLGQPAASLPH
ncbi:MarR family transcriptional regulator [Oceanibaculum nanhaiense]|uniref:MarR family transcriptional regulator n=1 Tax=Oceanibaculum nanhaiense TaxID=1909734 RepID=UPI000A3C12BA|nr:MarR family transcriptional regulator [Oceanibaculum nanhaiense]